VGGTERQAESEKSPAREEAASAWHRGAAFALADDDDGEARGQGAGCGEGGKVGLPNVKERADAVAGGLDDANGFAAEDSVRAGRDSFGGPSFWDDAGWIECSDRKLRQSPAEPSLRPLVDGIQNRVGILRGAGNAIVPQAAAEFIKAFLDAVEEQQIRLSIHKASDAVGKKCG
jgi:hypothetical protein